VGGHHHAPAALPPGKTRYPSYRRLGGPRCQFRRHGKSRPLGFDPRNVEPVARRYTDYAISSAIFRVRNFNKHRVFIFSTLLLTFCTHFIFLDLNVPKTQNQIFCVVFIMVHLMALLVAPARPVQRPRPGCNLRLYRGIWPEGWMRAAKTTSENSLPEAKNWYQDFQKRSSVNELTANFSEVLYGFQVFPHTLLHTTLMKLCPAIFEIDSLEFVARTPNVTDGLRVANLLSYHNCLRLRSLQFTHSI
jgi:hypothetical protein